jgi:hypothetical protein
VTQRSRQGREEVAVIGEKVREGIVRHHKEFPVKSNRASALGNECLRYLYYMRTAHTEKELPDPGLLEIFQEGDDQERATVRLLQQFGDYDLVEQWRELVMPEHNITGHIDGKILPINRNDSTWPVKDTDGQAQPVACEIKSMSPHIWASISSLDDMKNSQYPWVRGYIIQLQLYMEMTGEELGVFLLKDKTAARIKDIWMEKDPTIVSEAISKADAIEGAIRTGSAPDRAEGSQCRRCGFLTTCMPSIVNANAGEVVTSPELLELLDRRHALEAAGREFDQVDRLIKKMLEGQEKLIVCGDYVISGQMVRRKEYTVPGGSYWKRSIDFIGEESHEPA